MTSVVKRQPRGNRNHLRRGYVEIADMYRQRIDSGELKRGTPLPKLDDLAEQLRVSRMTAHRALALLQDELYLLPSQYLGGPVTVYLAGPERKYALLRNMLNDLEVDGEDLRISDMGIDGKSHSLVLNADTYLWELEQEETE